MACEPDPGPVNLGNPGEFTIEALAEIVRALAGQTLRSSGVVYRPLPSDDPVRRRPDITKAQQVLGWSPRVHLREGLQLTIEHCRRQMQTLDCSASSERAAVAASPR